MNKKNVVGESMRELSHNELNEIYGGEDVYKRQIIHCLPIVSVQEKLSR